MQYFSKPISVNCAEVDDYHDEFNNRVIGSSRAPLGVSFFGPNNTVEFSEGAFVRGAIQIRGEGNHIKIGTRTNLNLNAFVFAGSSVIFEDGTASSAPLAVTVSDGAQVHVGRNRLFAGGISLLSFDNHPIYDLKSRERTNFSQSIFLESDVWVGSDATILGGATVRHGSIVGTRSVVTSQTRSEEHTLLVGSPARIVKRKVAWAHPMIEPPSVMDQSWHQDCLDRIEQAELESEAKVVSFPRQSTNIPDSPTSHHS